jgi:geranylgeranyl diphosphate synthase type II
MPFDLQAYLHERRALIDAELERRCAEPAGPGQDVPESLRQAMAYSLLAGGKRLRPILVLAGYEAVAAGGSADLAAVVPAACAVEFVHTYSLIHDDLPAMDNDEFRRGKPTLHKTVGEAMAILAGDALLAEAFRLVASCSAAPAAIVEVVTGLAQAAGSAGLVGGQVIDIEATGKKIGLDVLRRLHRKKTGALLSISVWAGARLGGALPGSDALERLTRFADALGLAFQIIDDVLDITQDLATLGKDPGSDQKKGKTTYVDLLGVEGARRHAEEVMAAGLEALAPLDASAEPLHALARYTVHRVN